VAVSPSADGQVSAIPGAAGADVEVLEAVNVALPGRKLLVPDVVVVAAGAADETATRLPGAAAAQG
jgi:hypothetical protein